MIGSDKFVIVKNNQKGSILIGIIAAMLLFAALGTAILSLTSTATMNQVMANSAARAYYLAESGLRYAKYYLKTNVDTPGSRIFLNNKTRTIINEGSFDLDVKKVGSVTTIKSTGTFGTGDYKSVREVSDDYP